MKIEEFKNITIAYMRNIGGYGSQNEKLMDDFKNFLKNHDLLDDGSVILGIALDDPLLVSNDKLRYDVGIIINENKQIDLDIRKIDNGKYAIFEVAHTKEGVLSFWKNIPQLITDLSIDDKKPIIERYAMNKINNQLCEFCIPLK